MLRGQAQLPGAGLKTSAKAKYVPILSGDIQIFPASSPISAPLSDRGIRHKGEEPHRVPLQHLLLSQDMTAGR